MTSGLILNVLHKLFYSWFQTHLMKDTRQSDLCWLWRETGDWRQKILQQEDHEGSNAGCAAGEL